MTREPVHHGGANVSVIGSFMGFLVRVMDVLVGMCLDVPNVAYGGAPSNGFLEGCKGVFIEVWQGHGSACFGDVGDKGAGAVGNVA